MGGGGDGGGIGAGREGKDGHGGGGGGRGREGGMPTCSGRLGLASRRWCPDTWEGPPAPPPPPPQLLSDPSPSPHAGAVRKVEGTATGLLAARHARKRSSVGTRFTPPPPLPPHQLIRHRHDLLPALCAGPPPPPPLGPAVPPPQVKAHRLTLHLGTVRRVVIHQQARARRRTQLPLGHPPAAVAPPGVATAEALKGARVGGGEPGARLCRHRRLAGGDDHQPGAPVTEGGHPGRGAGQRRQPGQGARRKPPLHHRRGGRVGAAPGVGKAVG